jgi:cellobiose phosphorylase
MIAGKDAIMHGEAKNSWLTGAASWNYVAITQWILGIRPTYTGLEIKPVVPSDWMGFEVIRNFRGVRYVIHVIRNGPGNDVRLEMEGKSLEGTIIPIPPPGILEVQVSVRVG